MMSVRVGSITIEQANDYGPDGRAPIQWLLSIGDDRGTIKVYERQLRELATALEAWAKVWPPR